MATARLTVTELLPTPPLPEATAMTRVRSGMSVAGAGSAASRRARAMTSLRRSASITPVRTETDAHAGQRADVGLDVVLDLGAQGAAGHRQGHLDLDGPGLVDADPVDHAEIDDVGAELGVDHAGQRGAHRLLGWGGTTGPGLVTWAILSVDLGPAPRWRALVPARGRYRGGRVPSRERTGAPPP